MKKINVTVEHFLDSVSVRGPAAMRSTDDNCKISDFLRNSNLMRVRRDNQVQNRDFNPGG